jgi:hypothetical protein
VRPGLVPKIFFSRAREDAAFVELIAAFLGPFPTPVFVTPQAAVPGERWSGRIVAELDKATHVYVFWSQRAERFTRVAAEADAAAGAGRVVVPVRLDDTPLPRYMAGATCIEARFVAGPNGGHYDAGFTSGCVLDGKRLLTGLGVPISQVLSEAPWTGEPAAHPGEYAQTDPRLVAVALCAALRCPG